MSDADPDENIGHLLKEILSTSVGSDGSGPYVQTFALPREFMTADEVAAQISADHDVHVDCVLATLRQLADWWDTDVDHLVRFSTSPTYTIAEPEE